MIPLSANEIISFTPPSLANVATPPVFLLRPVTPRDARTFRRALIEEGLVNHEAAEVRAEQRRGLKALWSEEDYEKGITLLDGIWNAIDQGVDVDPDELAAAAEIERKLNRAWPMMAKMDADVREFNEIAPRIALCMFVMGWRNLQTPYKREAGLVPDGVSVTMANELFEIENRAIADKVVGAAAGTAYFELLSTVISTMNLTNGERQDFRSPSSSASTPTASTTDGTPPVASGSSATAPIRKTRRASSRKTSAT
jgi:hypothetical protein